MTAAVASRPEQLKGPLPRSPGPESIPWTMKDGTKVEIRPIHPDDEERMTKFHKGLSERSVYMRYFESLSFSARSAHSRLAQICFTDPERQTVLVALSGDPQFGERDIVAVGRLSKLTDPSKPEVALLVLDQFQGRGLGTELLRQLLQAARSQKIAHIEAESFETIHPSRESSRNSAFNCDCWIHVPCGNCDMKPWY